MEGNKKERKKGEVVHWGKEWGGTFWAKRHRPLGAGRKVRKKKNH